MIDWQTVTKWSMLVVDDEADNLEVVAETLEFKGLTVRTALNGNDALELLKSFTPTLILVDLSMPKMTGWELRTHIKALPQAKNIPIVALTAHAMAGDKERALDVGFDGYLTKPINVFTFLEDLQASLANYVPPVEVAVQSVIKQPAQNDSSTVSPKIPTSLDSAKADGNGVSTNQPVPIKDANLPSNGKTNDTIAPRSEMKVEL